jgi:hypothetical protein
MWMARGLGLPDQLGARFVACLRSMQLVHAFGANELRNIAAKFIFEVDAYDLFKGLFGDKT